MADKPVKLNLPSDPVKIGETPDGQPIHLDLKELIPTPDEDAERWSKTLDGRQRASVDKIAHEVIKNSHALALETIYNTGSKAMCESVERDDLAAFRQWVKTEGYEYIQDGLTTVIKKRGKILRSMTANIQPVAWRPLVAHRVNEINQREKAKLN